VNSNYLVRTPVGAQRESRRRESPPGANVDHGEEHMNRRPRIRQGLVGLLFLVAGTMKLITPGSVLAMQSPFQDEILRVIGGFEVLGAM
jgi:hypothetical protein